MRWRSLMNLIRRGLGNGMVLVDQDASYGMSDYVAILSHQLHLSCILFDSDSRTTHVSICHRRYWYNTHDLQSLFVDFLVDIAIKQVENKNVDNPKKKVSNDSDRSTESRHTSETPETSSTDSAIIHAPQLKGGSDITESKPDTTTNTSLDSVKCSRQRETIRCDICWQTTSICCSHHDDVRFWCLYRVSYDPPQYFYIILPHSSPNRAPVQSKPSSRFVWIFFIE